MFERVAKPLRHVSKGQQYAIEELEQISYSEFDNSRFSPE
jgi:hypothetical protein